MGVKRGDHIVRRQRLAIVESDALAQLEAPDLGVGRSLPALGERRLQAVFIVVLRQIVAQSKCQHTGEVVLDEGGIERVGRGTATYPEAVMATLLWRGGESGVAARPESGDGAKSGGTTDQRTPRYASLGIGSQQHPRFAIHTFLPRCGRGPVGLAPIRRNLLPFFLGYNRRNIALPQEKLGPSGRRMRLAFFPQSRQSGWR
jgi:hypothetical protein